MVKRRCGHIRAVLSGCCAMAGCGGESSALKGDGAGDDVLHPAKFLLFRRRVRRVVAGLDVVQHRSGFAPKEKSGRPTNTRRGCGRVEDRTRAAAEFSAAARRARPEAGGAVLLRMDEASGSRSMVGFRRIAWEVRASPCGGAESVGLVRRGLRTGWSDDEFQWAPGSATRRQGGAHADDHW